MDLRLPLADDAWPFTTGRALRALNLSVSLWGQRVTGLPIDFQFQPMSEFQAEQGPAQPKGVRATADNHEMQEEQRAADT